MDLSFDPSIISGEQMAAKLKDLSHANKENATDEELKKVATDFETIFVNILVKAMWKTIPKSGLFEENPAMDTYKDIMHKALSEEVGKMGGIGIAEEIYEQMQKNIVLEQNKDVRDKG